MPQPLDKNVAIQPLGELELDALFAYLNDHRADNGSTETGYFQPRPRRASSLLPEKQQAFRDGLNLPVGKPGWRRAWLARAADATIAGHVDLWAHPEPFTEHRCLLGMGVQRRFRRRGLGAALLDYALSWARSMASLEWVDLHVLATNETAIRLYLRTGFVKTGEVPDMFRFDGLTLTDITMTKRILR